LREVVRQDREALDLLDLCVARVRVVERLLYKAMDGGMLRERFQVFR
jgi:hypothetical protein